MLLTLNEAQNILRVDAGLNDEFIDSLIIAIPDYIEQTTGMRQEQQVREPLAKTAAGFLLTLWYHADHADDIKLQRTIDNLLKCITLKVMKE